jgi:hypothetical protein
MTYYRIAGRLRGAPTWRWRTTKLTARPSVWAHLQWSRWPEHPSPLLAPRGSLAYAYQAHLEERALWRTVLDTRSAIIG